LSPRVADLLGAFCELLQRVLVHSDVRRSMLTPGMHVLDVLLQLLRCPVPAALKGAIFKVLAACAQDEAVAAWLWQQLEAMQVINTNPDGGGQEATGLKFEMETVESSSKTYPATEGFCCLMQELLLRNLPLDLGANQQRRPGLGPYLDFLIEDVLLKADEREYTQPGEKWRIVARVLQVKECMSQ
ncbi:unnamed protein product, partial [Chrysoparadoxa australica]